MASSNRLIALLTEQLSVLRELQQTLQDEQKAIVGLDTQTMEMLNSQKEQLVNRQRGLAESIRLALVETAGQLGLATSASLGEIIDNSPASMRNLLEPLQREIKQCSSSVSVLANNNRTMLERFLGVVNESLSFILRILNTSNTYGVRGTYLANAQAGAVMVSKEA